MLKEELAQVLSQLARQKEIALEVQLETMTTIVAAPTMLMRALVNLGENAIRYTEVGKVMIRMEKQHQKSSSFLKTMVLVFPRRHWCMGKKCFGNKIKAALTPRIMGLVYQLLNE